MIIDNFKSTPGQQPTGGSYRNNQKPKLTGRFVLITALSLMAVAFILSKVFDFMPMVAGSTLDTAGIVVLSFILGWLACLVNEVYLIPLKVDRNRKEALRRLGFDLSPKIREDDKEKALGRK